MCKEEQIKILMEDRCTKFEAIEHLKRGTTIYNITEEPWDETYADELGVSLQEIKDQGNKLDIHYLEVDGIEYVIEYVL